MVGNAAFSSDFPNTADQRASSSECAKYEHAKKRKTPSMKEPRQLCAAWYEIAVWSIDYLNRWYPSGQLNG